MKRLRFRPTNKLLILVFVATLLVLICTYLTISPWLINATLALGVISVLGDFVLSLFARKLSLTVETRQNMALYRWQVISIVLKNESNKVLTADISPHLSETLELEQSFNQLALLPSGQKALISFNMRANKRGNAQLFGIELRLSSVLKLWQTSWLVEDIQQLKVYPDFSRVNGQTLNGVSNKPINGLKLTKKRGDGIEFHQLREYRQGDNLNQIDWQATSKRRRLISREYQEEQNQHVIVMLDATKHMNIEANMGSHFDHALNAILLLSHTVLKQGDWFSMQSFNQEIRWLSDVKGAQNVSRVMNHFYDLYPDHSVSDYSVAVNQVLARRTKRSLVLVVTTLSEQSLEELLPAVKLLQKHHLVALININNRAVTEVLEDEIENAAQADTYCAALSLLNTHKTNMARFRKEGVIAIDCKPEQLMPYLLNTYLNVKHSGAL